MKSTALSLLASSLLLPLSTLSATTADESSTGALIKFPSIVDGELANQTWDVSPSQFGYQAYGGSLEGVLVLPMNTSYHLECPGNQEPLGQNPYIHYIEDWFVEENDVTDYFLMVDRLDCYFVEKIERAQQLGASAVVMCDWLDEGLFTMWMPQDWKDDITIPAVLLQRSHCETLYAHMGVKNWNPSDISRTVYPSNEEMAWTIATIEWGLPHEDDRVEYQLWTSSNDYLGSEFKHNFNDTAIALDMANDTLFTPHMYILNGSHWGCDVAMVANGSNYWPCGRQCTNGGRYCSVDPEYDLEIGLDGLDVIQENLRSLCVWSYDKEYDGPIDDVVWWDYAVLWDENCGVYSNTSTNFNVECAYAQMDALVKDKSLSAYVANCVDDSGGYGLEDGKNVILERETRLKYNSSIYAIPMVRVNEFLIHGNIDCVPPVTKDSCAVLAAICAGFIEGTAPEVCYVTPSPTEAVCTDDERDCAGDCFGNHLTDACDACLLVSSADWNACIGCNGQTNSTSFDCEGTCGGHYSVNVCGFCKDTRHSGWEQYGQDCLGGCDLTLSTDRCGQCLSTSDNAWDSCVGCDNIANSGKEYNPCGFCIDASADNFASYGFDCRGICGYEMLYEWDECGECKATTDVSRNECVGCDGVANSDMALNGCGVCVSTSDANFDDYGKDCRAVCSGSVSETHYVDECGKCLLPASAGWNNCTSMVVTSESVEEIKEKEQAMTTVIVIVVVVAFLIVVAAALIILKMWRKQGAINARFDSLAATYVHMDEKGVSSSQSRFTAMNKSPDDGVGVQHTVADDSE